MTQLIRSVLHESANWLKQTKSKSNNLIYVYFLNREKKANR